LISITGTGKMGDSNPIVLHLGDDIKWNHDLYKKLEEKFTIKRSHSMNREDFKNALKTKQFGDFVAIYRPFWNTGGEMGNWDDELMYVDSPSSIGTYRSVSIEGHAIFRNRKS
jgi:hypothetical protein